MKSAVYGLLFMLGGVLTLTAWAQADAPVGEPAQKVTPAAPAPTAPVVKESKAASKAVPTTQPASAEDVIEDLMKKRQTTPVVEPIQRPAPSPVSGATTPTDPNVQGTAPNAKSGSLRLEGEFVVSRRGRVVRSPNGGSVLFVFEADGEKTPEAPMILVPCGKTQGMEDIVQERGDRAVFIVTGQVLTYRGANYLLPTITKEEFDCGNLNR